MAFFASLHQRAGGERWKKCNANLEFELSRTARILFAPVIGYDKAAKIAKVAYETNRTIREVAMEISGLDKAKLDELLDPAKQT